MITEGEGGKKSQNFVWLAGPVENTLNNHCQLKTTEYYLAI